MMTNATTGLGTPLHTLVLRSVLRPGMFAALMLLVLTLAFVSRTTADRSSAAKHMVGDVAPGADDRPLILPDR